jgi:hypothetical protein
MTDHNLAGTARIRALKTTLVSLLEGAREETIPLLQLQHGARLLTEAYQEMFNLGSKQLARDSADDFEATLLAVRDGYDSWRSVDAAFARTLDLAYNGYISPENLQTDEIYTQLREQVGERISALYAKLQAAWKEHVGARPWDGFMVPERRDVDRTQLETSLKLLVQGDHLDVEESIEALTGPLRYAFVNYLGDERGSLDLVEESLWMRPEIVVMNDYWTRHPEIRLLDVLSKKEGSRRSGAFARIQNLLTHRTSEAQPAKYVADEIGKIRLDQREPYLRCLMLHPDHEVRRYAVSNTGVEGFWKLATPHTVPCAAILSMLETVVRSKYYDENFQKIFFNTVHKRLFNLTSRAEVLYSRGIIRVFAQLPFFMEDEYFEKLTRLIDYVTRKEAAFKIEQSMLDEFVQGLRREKDKIGTLKAQAPNLTSVPPAVLRKLAREGHYWHELAMHPMYKIARETIPHINSPERALQLAKNHVVNQDVLREVGKKRSLFNSIPAKMALLSNPRTPPMVSLAYVMDLSKADIGQLLHRSTVHPEVRLHLRNRAGVA